MQEKTKIKQSKKLAKGVKSSKGITLIALVITIIVLLILAGVSIATLTGNNGILTKAKEAKEKTEVAQNDEQDILSKYEDMIEEYTGSESENGEMETKAQGSYIVIDHVSPVQHDLNVSLTSNTVDDFSSVIISKYNSNIFDISQMVQANKNVVDNGDGTYTFTYDSSRFSPYVDVNIPANTPFVLSTSYVEVSTSGENRIWAELTLSDGTLEYPAIKSSSDGSSVLEYDKQIVKIRLFMRDGSNWANVGDYIKFKELRINLGEYILPYEDYVSPQVLTAQSNGVVEGCTSLSPVTTLISNNNDVTINCEYMQIREYPLYGKKVVNFGDSIFGNYKAPLDISSFLAEYTGATVYNVGFGGTRMSSHAEYWNTLSMFSLADAITNKNFELQENAIANNTEGSNKFPTYFSDTLSVLKSIDFNDIDIITIAYGTNDFTGGKSIDNPNNNKDTSTFLGALRYSIEKISNAYPDIQIVICTPMYRFWMNDEGEFVEDSDTKVIANQKLTDFVENEKNVANEYNLLVIDNYNDLNINKTNYSEYFSATDGTHPNEKGRELIAEHIAKELYKKFK